MTVRELAWSTEDEAAVERLVRFANGRRQARALAVEQVRACAREALARPEGYAWLCGGEAGDARAVTTVCLAVATVAGVTVGVGAAHAGGVTPARAFGDLHGWDRFEPRRNVHACQGWAARKRADRVRLEARVIDARPPSDVRSLLERVLADPADDQARAVLADAWLEQGELRGEFVALQLEREGLAPGSSRLEAVLERERELLSAHRVRWLDGSAAVEVRFRRGFVEQATVRDPARSDELDALFAREPVEVLGFSGVLPLEGLRLAQAPWLSRVRELNFWMPTRVRSPRMSSMASAAVLGLDGLRDLLTSRGLGNLRGLCLAGQGLEPRGVRALLKDAPAVMPRLRSLAIADDQPGPDLLDAVLNSRWGRSLESVSFRSCGLGDDALGVFPALRGEVDLRDLTLDCNPLGDVGAMTLAESPRLAGLSSLSLRKCAITARGLKALLASPFLAGLRSLDLAENPCCDAEGTRLLESRFPAWRP